MVYLGFSVSFLQFEGINDLSHLELAGDRTMSLVSQRDVLRFLEVTINAAAAAVPAPPVLVRQQAVALRHQDARVFIVTPASRRPSRVPHVRSVFFFWLRKVLASLGV